MNLHTLKTKIKSSEIDTIIVAFPDVLGRLIGKRFTGQFFLESVVSQGTHGCNYLLTVNMEMDPMDGFKLANWEKGFGDFEMRPDLSSLRVLPWQAGTALVRASDVSFCHPNYFKSTTYLRFCKSAPNPLFIGFRH